MLNKNVVKIWWFICCFWEKGDFLYKIHTLYHKVADVEITVQIHISTYIWRQCTGCSLINVYFLNKMLGFFSTLPNLPLSNPPSGGLVFKHWQREIYRMRTIHTHTPTERRRAQISKSYKNLNSSWTRCTWNTYKCIPPPVFSDTLSL